MVLQKTILFISLLSGIILGASSCKNNQHEGKIQTLDSLKIVLDNSEKELLALDTLLMDSLQKEVTSTLKTIEKAVSAGAVRDTFTREDATILSDYRSIKKTLGKFEQKKEELLDELDFSRSQLVSLSTDLKKNLLDEEKARQYYQEEMRIAVELQQDVEARVKTIENTFARYSELYPKVQEILIKYNIASHENQHAEML